MNAAMNPLNTNIERWRPTEDLEDAVAASERNYQRLSKAFVHTADGKACATDDGDCLLWIEALDTIAKRIAQGHEDATQIRAGRASASHHGISNYKFTSLGRAICDLCRGAVPLIEHTCPSSRHKGRYATSTVPSANEHDVVHDNSAGVRFNPYIAVLLRACQRAMPALRSCGIFDADVSSERTRNKLDWLIRFVRRVCRSKYFKRLEVNRIRLQRKDLRSCCRYMASGFAQHSSQLILRVDLYIRPDHKAWADTRLAEQCIRRYLRALSECRIVPNVTRWICKRERGFDRGIHYHILVAMNGHKHQSACAFSKMLGDAWVRRCGPLRATYFNCYVRRHDYEFNALGSVHISDQRMLMGIREAIRYMVKGDGYVMTGHKRNLWRGIMPKADQQPKRGAPRKAGHDMWLVNEILRDVPA